MRTEGEAGRLADRDPRRSEPVGEPIVVGVRQQPPEVTLVVNSRPPEEMEKLELPATATASLAGFMINANALGKATFTSTYQR